MHELDQKLLRKKTGQIAAEFDARDFFCAESRERLFERLGLISLEPECILDIGSGTGAGVRALQKRFPTALVLGLDWSEAMWQRDAQTNICADAHNLPFADSSVDIVVSNLMLPGCAVPERIFQEAYRVLRHPGLLLFTTLGPDTFKELRKAWQKTDPAPHVHSFADMHNIGDALVQAGFRDPVMDVEHLNVTYAETDNLVTDLRAAGATNLLSNRRRGLTSPRLWQRMLTELEQARNPAGRLNISMELVTGQAWTGPPGAGVTMHEGEARVPVSDIITRRN